MGTKERENGKMASNNSKYTPEYRKEICQLIISSGRSATSIAEEMGIDKNTVCSWMRDYRKQNQLPTYAEEKGINMYPYVCAVPGVNFSAQSIFDSCAAITMLRIIQSSVSEVPT